jgi:hypothetical protein
MARPGRTESTSVPIWLKLSEVDSAQLDRVLARPEFAGWTRGEWCLEIIQTALRYYAGRPVVEPGRERARARPAADAPESVPAESEPAAAAPEPAAAAPEPAAPEPAAPARGAAAPRRAARKRAAPRAKRAAPTPAAAAAEAKAAAAEPAAAEAAAAEPEAAAAEPDPAEREAPEQFECSHPAEARDYQSGTCAACGAILWD